MGFDRVLWSSAWALREELDLREVLSSFRLTAEDLHELARLGLRCRVGLTEEDVDRVFLNRATEYVLARRLLRDRRCAGFAGGCCSRHSPSHHGSRAPTAPVLAGRHRWGSGEDAASFDERGVHITYRPGAEPEEAEVRELAAAIEAQRARAHQSGHLSIYDGHVEAPRVWLGANPLAVGQ